MRISSVRFTNFKALSRVSVSLQSMNVLVEPNYCGESTALSAFRKIERLKDSQARRVSKDLLECAIGRGSQGFLGCHLHRLRTVLSCLTGARYLIGEVV